MYSSGTNRKCGEESRFVKVDVAMCNHTKVGGTG